MGIPRIVMHMRQGRTEVIGTSMGAVAYVDEEDADGRKKAVDNLNEEKMEKSEECGSSGMWRKSRTKRGPASIPHAVRWKKASTAPCADPSSGHMTKKKKAPAA